MFFLKSKTKLIDTGFFDGFTDYHSHILPNVDDGIKTMDEALEVLEYFNELGIKKVVLTPHVMKGSVSNQETLRTFDLLTGACKVKIELKLGAEYMLDGDFTNQMEKGLRTLDEMQVLVETSLLSPPNNLYEQLYSLAINGNTPVIAHPERYTYMNATDYHKLKNNNYLLQLNILSLSGYYGKQALKNAEYLLEQDMYDIAGTDLHHLKIFRKWVDTLVVKPKQQQCLLKLRGR